MVTSYAPNHRKQSVKSFSTRSFLHLPNVFGRGNQFPDPFSGGSGKVVRQQIEPACPEARDSVRPEKGIELMQKDQLGDLGLPDVCLTVILHNSLFYKTFWYCFVNRYFRTGHSPAALRSHRQGRLHSRFLRVLRKRDDKKMEFAGYSRHLQRCGHFLLSCSLISV
jgi:hypothetical protein